MMSVPSMCRHTEFRRFLQRFFSERSTRYPRAWSGCLRSQGGRQTMMFSATFPQEIYPRQGQGRLITMGMILCLRILPLGIDLDPKMEVLHHISGHSLWEFDTCVFLPFKRKNTHDKRTMVDNFMCVFPFPLSYFLLFRDVQMLQIRRTQKME